MGKPTDVLTPFQLSVLKVLSKEPLLKDFYLTGGTALAAFHLQHRLSEDLDFFTGVPGGIVRAPPLMRKIARQIKAKLAMGRRFETLFECTLIRKTEPKDFVDVYCIHKRFLRLDRLICLARHKYPGLDDYGLAMAFLKVKDITFWPRMLVPIQESDLRDFYIREAKQRSRNIFQNE